VVHVKTSDSTKRVDQARLLHLHQVASNLGAHWHELDADDAAAALLEFARRRQITQIVLGSSRRNRWQDLVGGGSIVRRVTRLATADDVDVHVIARRERCLTVGEVRP
jgi:two-component system sensor histidine kinase KdpD